MEADNNLAKDAFENKLKHSRLKVINNLCQYSPFFLFPIATARADYQWWYLLVAVIVVICVGVLYMAVFRSIFMPKQVRMDNISKGARWFYFAMMIVCPVLTVVVYKLPPLGQLINSILAIVFNFGLTMLLCYKVAAK